MTQKLELMAKVEAYYEILKKVKDAELSQFIKEKIKEASEKLHSKPSMDFSETT